MLPFEDLLTAKLLAEDQIVPLDRLRAICVALDGGGDDDRLIDRLVDDGLLDIVDPRIAATEKKRQRYLFMMSDAVFSEMARRSGYISPQVLERMKAFQKREGYLRSLRDILIRSGYLDKPRLDRLVGEVDKRVANHREAILQQYRQTGFEGLARPLTKSSRSSTDVVIHRRTITGIQVPNAEASPRRATPAPSPAPAPTKPRGPITMKMTVPKIDDSQEAIDPFLGVTIGENYRLDRRIGKGAMGVVYLGTDLQDGELVAVKLVLDSLKPEETIARFKREILATSFVHHPHVIQIYDAGEMSDGAFYMVLEYVRGEELRAVLQRDRVLDPHRALRLTEQVLIGLDAIHRGGVVHRDIKPDNLMVTDREGAEFLKIMDFGIARILDEEDIAAQVFVTMEGQISGSPPYLAPEIISSDPIDGRVDLYAVGIMLVELLTGRYPIRAWGVRDFLTGHLYRPPIPLEELSDRAFPDCLQSFIDALLEKNPKDRPADAAAALKMIHDDIYPTLGAPAQP